MPKNTSYVKVLNGKGVPIRGLWRRGNRFVAQITTIDPDTHQKKVAKISMDPVKIQTVQEAKNELIRLKAQQTQGKLVHNKASPTFKELACKYLEYHQANIGHTKAEKTILNETGMLKRWIQAIGSFPSNRIPRSALEGFLTQVLMGKLPSDHKNAPKKTKQNTGRTANYYIVTLRNVLKYGQSHGYSIPLPDLPAYRHEAPRQRLISLEEIRKVTQTAVAEVRNGQMVADAIWLLAYSGMRRNEGFQMKWEDVDWEKGFLVVGAAPLSTKSGHRRYVHFNVNLKTHLQQMHQRRDRGSPWLFPSARGDAHIQDLSWGLNTAAEKAGLPHMRKWHLLRHFFISYCLMNRVDLKTIQEWVGHSSMDLINEIYSHLCQNHAKEQASKLEFK